MSVIDAMRELGMNVDEGLDRVMGDSALYEMMLGMFVDAVRENPVALEDFDKAEVEGLTKRIHMLKGVTGNLALTPLFNSYNQALVLLRAGDTAQAKAEYERLLPVQEKVIDQIKGWQAGNSL